MKYFTIEGHEIVRDGEYETRDGSKVVVLGFCKKSDYPIRGWKEWAFNHSLSWTMDGWTENNMIGDNHIHGDDLMRPWKQVVTDSDQVEEGWISIDGKEGMRPKVQLKFIHGDVVDAMLGDWGICWHNVISYRIVKEPSPEKKHYKLSEMFKVWYGCVGFLVNSKKEFIQPDDNYFPTLEMARAHTKHMERRTVIAITPADADSFYEGEGLE